MHVYWYQHVFMLVAYYSCLISSILLCVVQVPGVAPGWRSFLLEPAKLQFGAFERDMLALMNHWEVYDVGA